MKKIKFYISILLLTCVISVSAQDVHFSQYYFSPLSLNPANTGNYKGDWRFFGNYRSQWRDIDKAYNTYSVGGDANFFPKNLNFSGGLIFISDKSGGNLNINKILPSFAFHHKLYGFHMSYGVQVGYVMKSIDFYAHSFPNQLNWSTGKFDNTLNNQEVNVVQQSNYLDVNSGINISKKYGRIEPELGVAFFHLNKPKESFLSSNNQLPIRQAYNASLAYYLSGSIILKAYSLYGITTKVSDWVSGLNVEYVLHKGTFFTNSVFAGFMWRDGINRNADAGIATVGINYSHYTLGFSYDLTFSGLKTAVDYKGALEIAFIYRARTSRLIKKAIPCERY
ncbi:MAG: PorP/SprF family type IX secretion system membrane protein [Sphingobacteriaceae bacterium]|nr:PorP/SprF family type IX secretion system membrane protein [Sphingobacteriaceae bacterium]